MSRRVHFEIINDLLGLYARRNDRVGVICTHIERSKVVFFRRMIRAAARRATLLVCVSAYTADRLRALVESDADIVVIHHGVDAAEFELARLKTSPPGHRHPPRRLFRTRCCSGAMTHPPPATPDDAALRPPRAILFDWDNTLVDSWATIHEALNFLMQAMSKPLWTLAETRARAQRSLSHNFPLLFGERWEEARDIYLGRFREIHLERLRPLPGLASYALTSPPSGGAIPPASKANH